MFPKFPEFVPLTMESKVPFQSLSSGLPAVSDLTFSTLMIWWSGEEPTEISTINDNMVLRYKSASDPTASGLSLCGTNNVVESTDSLLSQLSPNGQAPKMVHVPDFVACQLNGDSKYQIVEELNYNEYLLSAEALASMSDPSQARFRKKVNRFIREATGPAVISELDLSDKAVADELFCYASDWMDRGGSKNDANRSELAALARTLRFAGYLGMSGLSVEIDGEVKGFTVLKDEIDKDTTIVNHIKVSDDFPHTFDFMTHAIAARAVEKKVSLINFEMDLGIDGLRRHKAGLRPVGFHKKYSIGYTS